MQIVRSGSLLAAGVAVTLLVGFLLQPANATSRSERDRVSFQVPKGWSLTLGRINGVIDPVTVFTVSTFHVRRGSPPSGVICSARLQHAWRKHGGYIQLAEERDGASLRRMLRRVPRRPRHFELNAKGWGGLCTPPNSGELTFREHGRAFYVFYGFGREAPARIRAHAEALLDGMRILGRR